MTTYRLTVTTPAENDVRECHQWWWENRSEEQADRWFTGINRAIQSLKHSPLMYGYATERMLMKHDIRQKPFGLGRHPSHRILFEVIDDEVIIYRVRSLAQDRLSLAEVIPGL